ncbi:hypothetical protein BGP_0799 [Beggiatoa sp. PS]|nr:hypothetical protein BGP_0799 [Beggiatoa sp. PS]
MSTANRQVFFEAPDFGFGPISTTIELVSHLTEEFNCQIISSGNSLALAKASLAKIAMHEVETFNSNGWVFVKNVIPPSSVIISNTNLPFAAWAIEQGHHVGVIDTLFWMWDSLPSELEQCLFYAAQYYFGHSKGHSNKYLNTLPVKMTRPFINETSWTDTCPNKRHGSVLISFGGMKVPIDPNLSKEYVRWILDNILPILFDSNQVTLVEIVGGMPDLHLVIQEKWRDDFRVQILGFLTPLAYRERLKSAQFVFISPGVNSIYETFTAKFAPFFLPAFSMSMIHQAYDLVRSLGYQHIAQWPWVDEVRKQFIGCDEMTGVSIVSDTIRKTIKEGKNTATFLKAPIENYLSSIDSPIWSSQANNLNSVLQSLPRCEDIVRGELHNFLNLRGQ